MAMDKGMQKTAQDYAATRDWPGYFRAVMGKPPRDTLLKALELFAAEGKVSGEAVDLGCGEGRDTLELVRRGWRVVAIDESAEGIALLRERAAEVETRIACFRGLKLPATDLVNASFSLPFCEPADFPALWEEIVGAIRPGGRFAGQFFGNEDSWAGLPDRTHHTRAEVEALLAPFDVEMMQEENRDSMTVSGMPKHWHVFHVVARRK